MAKNERTSPRIARLAAIAAIRPDLLTQAEIRSLAGSALTQARDKKKRKTKAKSKKPSTKKRSKK